MIKIEQKYEHDENINMLLQIHDELYFEIKEEFIEEITKNIKNIMETIFILNVPLSVSLAVGDSWQDLK